MVRHVIAVAALALLPGFAAAQEARTHTVVEGNTLWDLAVTYFGDGHQWTLILDANRDQIADPNVIEPGWVLVIPGEGGVVTAVEVTSQPPEQEMAGEAEMADEMAEEAEAEEMAAARPQQPPQEKPRTVFYRDLLATTVSEAAGFGRNLVEVTADEFYSAPWAIPEGAEPEFAGRLTGVIGETRGSSIETVRPFERLEMSWEGARPPVGSLVQVFRPGRDIVEFGTVMQPSGVIVIDESGPGGLAGHIESMFGRVERGALLRTAPAFSPQLAATDRAQRGPDEATLLEFSEERAIHGIGDHVFLDIGRSDGVQIGDQYYLIADGEVGGRVKVVNLLDDLATARIVELRNPAFERGAMFRSAPPQLP